MEADAAKAKEGKQQKEELAKANSLAMEQMDMSEDNNRKVTATQTIRKFSDLECDSQSDREEFIGYNKVSGSEDELEVDEEAVDDAKNLKAS